MDRIGESLLDELEVKALGALVRQAAEGNSGAAASALAAVQRMREKGAAALHRERVAELSDRPAELAGYLGLLGLTREEAEKRLGHKMTRLEDAAWRQGEEDRLLEVRAVELGRMRTSGDVPKWATRRHSG